MLSSICKFVSVGGLAVYMSFMSTFLEVRQYRHGRTPLWAQDNPPGLRTMVTTPLMKVLSVVSVSPGSGVALADMV